MILRHPLFEGSICKQLWIRLVDAAHRQTAAGRWISVSGKVLGFSKAY